VEGVATTLPFGRFVCQHPAFLTGKFDTGFVKNYYTPEVIAEKAQVESEIAAHLGVALYLEHHDRLAVPNTGGAEWMNRKQ